jgi:hypothetical protein
MEQIMLDGGKLQRLRNEYEGYIYDIKRKLDDDPMVARVVAASERTALTAAVAEHQEWLGGPEQECALLQQFADRLAALRRLAGPAETRAVELAKRPRAFQSLNETIARIENIVTKLWPIEKPWLGQSYFTSVNNVLNQTKRFFNEKVAAQAVLNDADDRAVTAEEIEQRRNYLEQALIALTK